jgi:DNA-binding transcriptional MerR regulator
MVSTTVTKYSGVMTETKYLTRTEAAELAGVYIRTLDRWAHLGWLPVHREGPTGRPRFRPADVLAMRAQAPERRLRRKLR